MNNLEIFNNVRFGEVRVTTNEQNEPVFCLADVCRILDLIPSKVSQRLSEDVLSKYPLSTNGGTQVVNFVNEDGLYDVVLDSRKPEAKQFRKWITSEILPSIRKHGAYATAETIDDIIANPDNMIRLLTALKEERDHKLLIERQNETLKGINNEQQHQIKLQAPKVEYYEKVIDSKALIAINVIANDLGISAISLNRFLRERGIIYSVNGTFVLSSKLRDKGYAKTKTFPYTSKTGEPLTAEHLYWTEKGREFIIDLYNRSHAKTA